MSGSARHIINEIYSDVMFELAEEAGLVDDVAQDLVEVGKVLREETEFTTMLLSHELKEDEKANIVRRVFGGKVNTLTLDFLCVLARRNRIGFLAGISDRYEVLLDQLKNLFRVDVTLAKEPDETLLEKLKVDIKDAIKSDVKLHIKVDPEIIGGIVIRQGDMVIDNSVKAILDRTVNVIVDKSKEKLQEKD